jgi:hypothetical protein
VPDCKKSSAITLRQASVLLLKVSINVSEPFLKFITFEFILIAHHYETFIYSLIELHYVLLLVSCKKRREKPKVIYDTIIKEKISKVDSTQVAISTASDVRN